MSLGSVSFFIFLAVTALVYFLTPGRFRYLVLLAGSYVFYFLSGPNYVPFLLVLTVTTYFGGRILSGMSEKSRAELSGRKDLSREEKRALRKKSTRKKRRVLAVLCLIDFGTLAAVKYTVAFLPILSLFGVSGETVSGGIIVPLGISFYTFQAVGYLMDVYRDREAAERNFGKLALFLAFFPQIVQGPISRHSQLAPQLAEPHDFDFDRLRLGASLMLWGCFKKLLIADRVAVISTAIFAPDSGYRGIYILLGALAYSVRVYADFSGGIDIARGAAQVLGIDVTPNFARPYFADSIGEFWRRWHITLGAWFRDYVFYPLSLSGPFTKLGKWVRARNAYVGKLVPVLLSQFIVFFLIGIWHGSSLKYVAFGFYHGILIVGGILLGPKCHALAERLGIQMDRFSYRLFSILRTLTLVVLGRIFTMGRTLADSLDLFRRILPLDNGGTLLRGGLFKLGLDPQEWLVLLLSTGLLFTASVLQERQIHLRESLLRQNLWLRWAVYLGLFLMILIFGVYGVGYSAGDFIYRGF